MCPIIVSVLPGPYERWFSEAAGQPSPIEPRSTCDDCRMLPGADDLPLQGPFDPDVRCCSFHPHLAPHFVGALIEADHPLVRARIRDRWGVSPLGLGPPENFQVARFGHGTVCPFYDHARCTIWAERGIVCAAFHCKLERGATGAALWNRLIVLFQVVERALARWRLVECGLDAASCDALLRAPGDPELDARAWGAWHGREEEYFLAAHRAIVALSFAQVIALGGSELTGLADAVRLLMSRYQSLELPARLTRNPETLYQLGRFHSRGASLDPLAVPDEIVARLDRPEEIDELWRRKLVDWQVLVPG